jgi:hypothetical protein
VLNAACHPIEYVGIELFVAASDIVMNVPKVLGTLRLAIDMIGYDGKARIGIDGPANMAIVLNYNG